MRLIHTPPHGLHILQKISLTLMGVLTLITFLAANMHALLWQSSEWLVSTVLPSVVVELTNEERADNAAPLLRRNSTLDEAARLKAEHMAANEYFSHFSPDGVSPWHWFDEAGYVYAHAGENLAIHFTDSSEVVEAWMKSPTHRQNIVNGLYTEIGVGTARGEYEGYDTVYVVQLFGTPAVLPTPPVEDVYETDTQVSVEQVTESSFDSPTEAEVLVLGTEEPLELTEEESLPTISTQSDDGLIENEVLNIPLDEEVVDIPNTEENTVVAVNPEPVDPVLSDNVVEQHNMGLADDVVTVYSPIISTSSGLAVANITSQHQDHAGATAASIVTQPNALLQSVYIVLGTVVLILLSISIALGARRFHYAQVAYGLLLIVGMGGLWFVHSLLTKGAVIV